MTREMSKKTVCFRGVSTTLDHEPRIGVCNRCRKVSRTVLHHEEYDDNNPLAHTIELCYICHGKAHSESGYNTKNMKLVNIKISVELHRRLGQLGTLGETYEDVVQRLYDFYKQSTSSNPNIRLSIDRR